MSSVFVTSRKLAGGAVRWRLQWRDGAWQGARTFTNEPAARKWEAVLKAAGIREGVALLDTQDDPDGGGATLVTVADAARQHLTQLTGITDGTRVDYRRIVERDILPALGDLPISALGREAIAAWINGLNGSAKTISNKHGLLSAICAGAVEAGLITSNPCRGMRLPSGVRREPMFMSPAQLADLIAAIPEYWRPLVTVLAGTGMRWGEATALRGHDIDVTATHVRARVARSWKRSPAGGPMIEGAPKSALSRRTVPIPAGSPAATIVADRAATAGPKLLFASPRGAPIRTGYFHDRAWTPAMKVLEGQGWPRRPRVHDLRHTAASLMLAEGHEPHAVAAVMGHDVLVTLHVYGHHRAGAREAAMTSLGDALAAALDGADSNGS